MYNVAYIFFISAVSIQNSEFVKNACVYSGTDYTFPVLLLMWKYVPSLQINIDVKYTISNLMAFISS
jgi:hypothetical protein